jgi:hypothetical protein
MEEAIRKPARSTTDWPIREKQTSHTLHLPELVDTHQAAKILGRSPATLKRWRHQRIGPNWIELEGRVSYDVAVLVEHIRKNTRVASVRAAMEETREAV